LDLSDFETATQTNVERPDEFVKKIAQNFAQNIFVKIDAHL
jgi:hypothetical protein